MTTPLPIGARPDAMSTETRIHPQVRNLAVLALLLALSLAVLVPASPRFQKLPSFDSGVFLYTGWRVTEGALPYRDVWDHKPPLIFYLDALGLWMSGGSRWGVWALEVVSLLSASVLGFSLLRRAFGVWAALYASVAWMTSAFVAMDGGNYTTEFALPLQFGLLWLCGTAPEGPFSLRRALGCGILSGLLFWLKQNDIGIPLALGLYLLLEIGIYKPRRARMWSLAGMIGGALLVSLVVISPFALQGALTQFWDAAFAFNFEYIHGTWLERALSLRYVPVNLPVMGLTLFAILGWLFGALSLGNSALSRRQIWHKWGEVLESLWGERGRGNTDSLQNARVLRLLGVVLMALPMELLLVSLSSNSYDHYFLALLPVFAVLSAFTFRLLLALLERAATARGTLAAFTIIFVAAFLLLAAEYIQPVLLRIVNRQNEVVLHYLQDNTAANDFIFFWDGEARLLFESRRRAPTRFIYLKMLRPRYASVDKTVELLQDLQTRPPRLILVSGAADAPFLEFPIRSPQIDAAITQIRAGYQVKDNLGEWTVLERRTP